MSKEINVPTGTCAKVGEAEVMVHGGVRDVLIANQIVDIQKIERLASLARYANIMVAVDDEKNCQDISVIAKKWDVHIDILVEVDVGLNRCGVTSEDEALKNGRGDLNGTENSYTASNS